MKLADLQESFARAIVEANGEPKFLPGLSPAGTLKTTREAFAVYVNGYPARLTEALGEAYEAVWSVLGDECFFETCESFIKAYPSENFNLSNYHQKFPDFLGEQKELIQDFPFLPELADFEWQFHQVFHESSVAITDLTEADRQGLCETSRIQLITRIRFFAFKYSSYEIWKNRKRNENIDFSQPQSLILFKVGDQQVRTLVLKSEVWTLLKEINAGTGFQDSIIKTQNLIGEDSVSESVVSELFAVMSQNHLIRKIEN